MAPDESSQDRYRLARIAGLGFSVPMILLAAPLVGLFGGKWLDSRFGTGPWLMLLGLGLGLIAGAVQVRQLWRKLSRDL